MKNIIESIKDNVTKLVVVGLLLFGTIESKAASTSVTVLAGVMTNFNLLVSAPLKVSQVIITSPTTNAASFQFIDTYTNWLKFTNVAYTNILSYATNWINTWTNFYGVTNSVTNLALIDVTNTVLGTTNLFNVNLIASSPTNTSTKFDNLNQTYLYGLWVTNTSPASGTITITYQQ